MQRKELGIRFSEEGQKSICDYSTIRETKLLNVPGGREPLL